MQLQHFQSNKQQSIVTPRDWSIVEGAFHNTAPYNYVILDNFLNPETCEYVHTTLVNHWGWRYKNWVSQHLHNNEPNIPIVREIAGTLKECLPSLFHDMGLITYWALMYHKNTPGRLHADNAGLTLTLWVTPEEYNQDPKSGGLVLFDVKRAPEIMPHEHLKNEWAEEYVQQYTKGNRETIPYKWNRAVLFDGKTFHKTDDLSFKDEGPMSRRINLSFAFDDLQTYREKMKQYLPEEN